MKKRTKNTVAVALFAAVMCVLSVITIPLPFSPVPFTLSLLGVFLSGCFLPPSSALLSQLIYILIGAVGLPVYSGFQGGLAVLVGPTGGFLIAYPIMAFVTAIFVKKNGLKMLLGMGLGLLICYAVGSFFYCLTTHAPFFAALSTVVLPFVIFDIIKATVAAAIYRAVEKRMNK